MSSSTNLQPPKPSSLHHHLIHNASIYNGVEAYNTWMALDPNTGVIESVGATNPPTEHYTEHDKTDYKGCLVLPGFHDSHLHMLMYGQLLSEVNLRGCTSIQEMKQTIVDFRLKNPTAKWIIGFGWEQDLLGRFPVAMDIDEVCRDVPVLLKRVCFHMAVGNQKLLDLAGITESHPSLSEVERYPPHHQKAGTPNGILKEKVLFGLSKLKPLETKEERLGFLKIAIEDLLKAGVTSAHPCEENTWDEFIHLHDNQQLPIRIFYCTYGWPKDSPTGNSKSKNNSMENSESINTSLKILKNGSKLSETESNTTKIQEIMNSPFYSFPETPEAGRGLMLGCSRIKFFADGALGARTAAISQPYPQHLADHSSRCLHSNQGLLLLTEEELEEKLGYIALERGYRVEVHVIGDRAADMVLGVIERVGIPPEKRPVFIHCQILREDLISRMKQRGVIANVQPQFVNTDARWLSDSLPATLLQYAYVWKTLLDQGIPVAGGSDAPVETPRPLLGIFDSIFRLVGNRDVHENKHVFKPEECLSIHQAIDLYSKTAAFTAGKEKELGQLLPGYQADFVLLDRDIVAEPQLAATAVVMETWVAGVKRWSFEE